MVIKIGGFELTEVWDGMLYKNLSDYPNISDWELRTTIENDCKDIWEWSEKVYQAVERGV